jgi:hypothetical protein
MIPCEECLVLAICRNKLKDKTLNCSILNKWLMELIGEDSGCYGSDCNPLLCETGRSFTLMTRTDEANRYLKNGKTSK